MEVTRITLDIANVSSTRFVKFKQKTELERMISSINDRIIALCEHKVEVESLLI